MVLLQYGLFAHIKLVSGHLSRECPQPKNKACYTCGQEGHLSSACPQGPGAGGFGGASGGGECYRCGKPGHIVSAVWGLACNCVKRT